MEDKKEGKKNETRFHEDILLDRIRNTMKK
jgi:hypothetical protein